MWRDEHAGSRGLTVSPPKGDVPLFIGYTTEAGSKIVYRQVKILPRSAILKSTREEGEMRYIVAFLVAVYITPFLLVFADPSSSYNIGIKYGFWDWVKAFLWPISGWFK